MTWAEKMQKPRKKQTSAVPSLVICLIFVTIPFLLPEAPLFSEAWQTLVGITLFCFFCALLAFVTFVWLAIYNAIQRRRQLVDLNALSPIPSALSTISEKVVIRTTVLQVHRLVPAFSDRMANFFQDQRVLKDHIAYLERIHKDVIETVGLALRHYQADHSRLLQQQFVLQRLAQAASRAANRLEARFPFIRGEHVPAPYRGNSLMPAPPSIVTSAQYNQRIVVLGAATTSVLLRAIHTGLSRSNLFFAILALVATAAIGVIQFQKTIRQMHDAHGQVRTYAANAANDVQALWRAHAEMVSISETVHDQSMELRRLLEWVDEQEQSGTFKGDVELSDSAKQNLLALKTYAMISRLQTTRAV